MSDAKTPRLHHLRAGSGPALLLLHGLGGSTVIWRPVLDLLAAEREVLALDLPGFGRSPALADGLVPSAANIAAAVTEFVATQGIRRPAVAGNSLGAWIALEMARNDDAASVVAISPAGLWRDPLGPRRSDAYGVGRALRPLITALLRTEGGRKRMLRTFVARPERVPADDAREMITSYLRSPSYRATNAEMRNGVFEAAAEVSVPVTIAWGAEDRIVGRPSRTRRPPGARYVEMPGWGHTPTWDDPDGVARLILEATAGGA